MRFCRTVPIQLNSACAPRCSNEERQCNDGKYSRYHVWWYCTYSAQLNGPIKTAIDSLDPLAGGRLYREAAAETPFQLHSPLNTPSRILLNMKGGRDLGR
jgi:hypothetical protein